MTYSGLKTLTFPKRLCAMNINGVGCSSATISLHGVEYTHTCGKIIGYQKESPDAFGLYYTIIVVSQLVTLMWMVLVSHMDVIPGNTSGLLQLLFTKFSLPIVSTFVPAPTSTTQ